MEPASPPSSPAAPLTIGGLAARTGVSEGTLRVWEARHGFPVPQRLPSGHRRYTAEDLAQVLEVRRLRDAGFELAQAIARARGTSGASESLFRTLRHRFDHLDVEVLDKPALLALTRAFEDCCCARASGPLLFGCFQSEGNYRASEARWRDMTTSAGQVVVLAGFRQALLPAGRPAEIPLPPGSPLRREWAVVCTAPEACGALVAWERPGRPRRFETLWSLEPRVAETAAQVLRHAVSEQSPTLGRELEERLATVTVVRENDGLRLAAEVAVRAVVYAQEAARQS